MADQKSVQLLAFNFASRTFAYLRLAQGLSRSLSSFSSFMREYLDKAIKADKCAQYVDDIGIATNTPDELKNNLREVFQCIRAAGLRLTMTKYQFGAKKVFRPIRSGTPEPQDPKILANTQVPSNEERTSTIYRICELLQKLHSPIIREDSPFPRTHQIRQTCQNRSRTHNQL